MSNKNIEIIKLFKKNISKVVTLKKFVISNKIVTPKEIPSNIQKGYPVIQAYNDKDNDFILMQLWVKLLYDIPKASNYYFAIYHLYYIWKPEMINFAYKPCLFYNNKLVDNLTRTFFCTIWLSLVNKKRKPLRLILDLFFHLSKSLSFLLSLTLLKMRPIIFKYLVMFKCASISK